ncbi:Phytochelatin synthase [Tistlia consotensis]|uniref:glutathione gamma-glutamylcysteinyltransferase n=1 Tax=Tistlia consotensis USBA 355 TaxID=560819 RepID=A0A1Y6CBV9_9PROT|nr:phytochelatin synthase family protein [Tistlia consotensis]SMF47533.1 Phytochelatin synthase [Tistlia consotensis USBA 355]SNR82355.1 Phytochelatin synthase [Tistlia consotensis]
MRRSLRGACGALALVVGLVLALAPARADSQAPAKPKFGPDAVPFYAAPDYLRSHAAPDWWALSGFYVPQQTSSACSLAAIVTVLNAFRGLPASAEEPIVTQAALLEKTGDEGWTAKVVEEGDGITFADLPVYLDESLKAYGLSGYAIEVVRPTADTPEELARLQALLAENEASADDFLLVYFNQGVLTGDWDGPHVSPVGAYDAGSGRVLLLDVDREWYVPYWSSAEKLLQAMLRPAPADQGVLAGQTGGLVRLKRVGS